MIEDLEEKDEFESNGKHLSRDVAIIGEGPQGGTEVSMQVLQNIYNEITGGSEKLNKGYDKPFCVEMTDIEQLNQKFEKVSEQYNILSKNCMVKVYHLNDTQEKFSSFKRIMSLSSHWQHFIYY